MAAAETTTFRAWFGVIAGKLARLPGGFDIAMGGKIFFYPAANEAATFAVLRAELAKED
jgi:hypothetical protein